MIPICPDDIPSKIEEFRKYLEDRTQHHLGYPYNLDIDYSALQCLQNFSINNLGDPFVESNYGVHSRRFELGVLEWFATMWRIPRDEYWGYITNCGTEGNLHGILVGRECLPDAILYTSRETHYSVFKAAMMYRMTLKVIRTRPTGDIDCEDLKQQLDVTKPAILNVNIGTTVKGAIDDLDLVLATLYQCGYTDDRFYIHCDGALFGLMVPFVKKSPFVTFEKPIGSVSVSGHKFAGCPMPCGVSITRKRCVDKIANSVEYLNSRDATIMGSRNGHAPVYLWYTLSRKGHLGLRKDVRKCLRNAILLKQKLKELGVVCMSNGNTVVFERPHADVVRKWQLACEGPIAHAVIMPNVNPEKIDLFVSDYMDSRRRHLPGEDQIRLCQEVLGLKTGS